VTRCAAAVHRPGASAWPQGDARKTIRARRLIIALLLAVWPMLFLSHPAAAALRIRVDPGARPGMTGSKLVVASLEDAVALLRRHRATPGGDGAATIEFSSGVHRLARSVQIDAVLGGRAGQPLVLRGAPDGSTRLSGSIPLARASEPPPPGLDPGQRRRALGYRLPVAAATESSIEVHRIHPVPSPPVGLEVFDEDGALAPARWPNEGWARVKLPRAQRSAGPGGDPVILVPGGRADRWIGETDLWVAGYLGQDWSFETLPARTLAPGAQRLTLAGDPHYPLREGDRFYVENALAELDAPGEWWRDQARGLVYLIPRRPGPVEVSVAAGLIEIAGANHVRLEGLTFERVRGDAVTITGGDDVILEDCTIRWSGGRGLVVDGATHSGVRRSVIADTGEGGVYLSGGDRARLAPADNFVEDSVLVRFARLGRTYKNAVTIDGVGMRVTGNLMAHAPHFAIRFQGNDHEIAFNEVFDVANDTSDAAAIYTGRDIAAQGTRVHGNFLHDIRPRPDAMPSFEVKGIYLDDMASGTAIEGNLFLRVQQPVFVGGGRDNAVTGNVFIASPPAFFLDGRGEVWAAPPITSADNPVRAAFDAVPATRPPWTNRYPGLARLLTDEPLAAKRNAFRDNLLVESGPPRIEQGADPRRQVIEGNIVGAVPGAATVLSPTAVATAIKAAGFALDLPFDKMDRVASLSRDARLKRRSGSLLSREDEP